MDSPLFVTPPVPSRDSTDASHNRLTSSAGSDFSTLLDQQLAATQLSPFTPATPTPAPPLGFLSGLSQGNFFAPLEQLLAMRLMQLIGQMMMGMEQANAGVPRGLPVQGPISQEYHDGHRALDIAIPVGTPIRATMSGRVTHAGWNTEGYGNLVIVENGPHKTYYAHLDSIPVKVGQFVTAGSLVGLSGNTGNSTGPHLHYEVRLNGQRVAPGAQM